MIVTAIATHKTQVGVTEVAMMIILERPMMPMELQQLLNSEGC
jgi:hypothetical protein